MKFKGTRADYKKFRKSNRIERVRIKKERKQQEEFMAYSLRSMLKVVQNIKVPDLDPRIYYYNNPKTQR